MKTQLEALKNKVISEIESCDSLAHLEEFKIKILGKKGELTSILKGVATLNPEQRPVIGKLANEFKNDLSQLLDNKKQTLEKAGFAEALKSDNTDATLPPLGIKPGAQHPINQTITRICDLFARLGFSVKEGPDIENDDTNFEALNIPKDHPARDMHDTFYLTSGDLLRTHTSPVQIRTMLKEKPPLRFLAPGKVYRCDADMSHSPVFHQIEGLYVDKKVTFAELKGTLEFFLKSLFGSKVNVRFRPSYFPFTEPSAEVDVECVNCKGKGCGVCKQSGWLEILGAGMVHRNVFRAVDYSPDELSGFAFGLGIERIAMLTYGIPDIRLFYENDLRFLEQFR